MKTSVPATTSYDQKTSSPLEISPNKNAVASDFGHGTFSGADIQVYAHYNSSSSDTKLLNSMKIRFNSEIDSILKDIDFIQSYEGANANKNASNIALINMYEQLRYLESEVDRIDKTLLKTTSSIVKPIGTIHTFSYSIFREKVPSRALGRVYPKLFTRGPRSIAGSMVFTAVNRHVFYDFLELNSEMHNTGTSDYDRYAETTALTDQLPPLDFSLVFNNEYGASSYMGVYGVEFLQEGGTFSVEDIYSENIMQYVARDIDLMRPIGYRSINSNGTTTWSDTASNMSETYNKLNTRIRRNPFI